VIVRKRAGNGRPGPLQVFEKRAEAFGGFIRLAGPKKRLHLDPEAVLRHAANCQFLRHIL
jgi:hypothetical protein